MVQSRRETVSKYLQISTSHVLTSGFGNILMVIWFNCDQDPDNESN
jgi:hypothetical protein